ncbi:Tigger transposable element-derived protein 1 [Frankliniella fusca]|uniref:Tigger transposable element-derived protein 1 n=1 Tax=Frankliniella fusca TaxID=407009 RepID=A0AAE1LKW4_9NEOP|nr:Tigger transposable element-derived protein 1 [Frankliniella fusca]
MVRKYIPKTKRKVTSPSKLRLAVESVIKSDYAIRQAAVLHGINRHFLRLQIFSTVLEDSIASYCIEVARMGYGLSVEMVRELAFEVAQKNNLKFPTSWVTNQKAGIDWFHGFMKRHPEISIRVPESCSIARAMAFNKTTVENYFNKLEEVLSRHSSFGDGCSIYNLDETSTSTVQNARKLISPKGVKQVHQVKGAERGVSVTTAVIIGTNGAFLPPVLIFPRKKIVSSLTIGSYLGTLGLGNEKGYMTKATFVLVMKHFITCTGASKENPKVLLLDNVESHFSTKTLDLARENGVVVFTFPPHCTHRLQPLDVGVFGPFKTYYDGAIHSYYQRNPGVPATIYHIAGFVKEAMMKISPATIIKKVTRKPPSDDSVLSTNKINDEEITVGELLENEKVDDPDPITRTEESLDVNVPPPLLTPRKIRGYPQAKDKEKKRMPRRKGKCMVATDSPNKQEIEEREIQQHLKKSSAEERKKKREEQDVAKKLKQEGGKKKKGMATKKVLTYSSDSDNSVSQGECVIDKNVPITKSKVLCDKTPVEGDYVLVQFVSGKQLTHFVGKVVKDCDEDCDYEVSYLRHYKDGKFKMPLIPDIASVHESDIKCKLPKPVYPDGYTKRQQSLLLFNFDFSGMKLG